MNDSATCAAELEIRNLLARLGRANDFGSIDEYLSAFAEDTVLQLPGMPAGRLDARAHRGVA